MDSATWIPAGFHIRSRSLIPGNYDQISSGHTLDPESMASMYLSTWNPCWSPCAQYFPGQHTFQWNELSALLCLLFVYFHWWVWCICWYSNNCIKFTKPIIYIMTTLVHSAMKYSPDSDGTKPQETCIRPSCSWVIGHGLSPFVEINKSVWKRAGIKEDKHTPDNDEGSSGHILLPLSWVR